MIRLHLGVGVLMIVAFGAPAVMADPMDVDTYTINFTVASGGLLPTSGSFEYDPDVANFVVDEPVSMTFPVVWDGLTFELEQFANEPIVHGSPSCLNGDIGAAASFDLLRGTCGGEWFADVEGPNIKSFEFFAGDETDGITLINEEFEVDENGNGSFVDSDVKGTPTSDDIIASGGWEITRTSGPNPCPPAPETCLGGTIQGVAGGGQPPPSTMNVPEPSSLWLLGIGLFVLGGLNRFRTRLRT